MPYSIDPNIYEDRTVGAKFDPPIDEDLFRAISFAKSVGPDGNFTEPLHDEDVAAIPKTLLVRKPERGDIPHLLGWLCGPWIVSERAREIIERLEPGVHEFVPIEVKNVDRKTSHGTYYLILLRQTLDAIILQDGGTYVLKASAIRGRHLWRDVPPKDLKHFCSDELHDRLQAEGLDGWYFRRCVVRKI